ncbi:MAG TPA: hypothetical protein VF691_03950, partial [Cytophagaceae bacterium]
MKLFSLFFAFLILQYSNAKGQEIISLGARSAGVANTSGTFEDPYATFNNVAGSASLTGVQFASSLENRFGLRSLSTIGFASSINTKFGVPSIS